MSIKGNAEGNVLRGSIANPDVIYGKSAYEIAVMHGFEGTEEEWLESLTEQTKKNAEEVIAEADKQIDNIEAAEQAAVSHIESMAEEALNVVQTTGNSETAVMSQKAVTDEMTNRQKVINGTTLCRNLIGMNPNVYYSVFIPAGTSVHLESKDGGEETRYNALYFYDEHKNQVDLINIAPGSISRTNTYNDGDIYFAKWDRQSAVDCQLEYGRTATEYQEYFPNLVMTQQEISEIQKELSKGEYGLPDYYSDYLPTKVEQILDNVATTGEKGDCFYFITDLHWSSNTKHSPALMRAIDDQCGVGKIINGGDWYNKYSDKTDAYKVMLQYQKAMDDMRLFDRMYTVVGNHEWNNPGAVLGASYQLTQSEVYSFMYQRFRTTNRQPVFAFDRAGNPLLAYYVDDDYKKRRYYFIPSNYGSTIDIEVKIWFCKDLKTVPNGYGVVVVSHVCTDTTAHAITSHFSEIAGALDALKNHRSYEYYGVNDYSNTDATPLYCITGHTHMDGCVITEGGIVCTATTTDACNQADSGRTDASGTVDEQAFEVATDDANGLLSFVRIGGGVNRKWHYNATEVNTSAMLAPTLNGSLTWSSSNEAVATVSEGVVTKVAIGASLVCATDSNGDKEFWAIICK